MEYESIRSFRADLKAAFDYVEGGAEEGDCIIRRGDTLFKLTLENWKAAEEVKEMSVCRNGHPIPDGRDRCLAKGCKYS